MRDVSTAMLFANGMLMVFGEDGEQLDDLQGATTLERLESIRDRSTPDTQWLGFDEGGPLLWRDQGGLTPHCPYDTDGDGDCGRHHCPYCHGGPR